MGLFWNLVQQSMIASNAAQAGTLEQRVNYLETELKRTQELLHETLKVLEEVSNRDLNNDGKIG